MQYYVKLPRYMKYMSENELRQYFPKKRNKDGELVDGFTKAYLMRSMILNEKEFSETDYNRSLRELWYSFIKPTLDKLGMLTEEDSTEEGLTMWDATLSKYCAELVKDGLLTYKDLHIEDTSRQKKLPAEYYRNPVVSTYGYQISVAENPNIIVVVEKDSVYSVVSSMAALLGITCISAKGQPAFAAIEYLVRSIFRRDNYDNLYIFSFTDYDPAGAYIANAVADQCRAMCDTLGHEHVQISQERLGLNPTQLSDNEIHSNKYTPKGANGHRSKGVETMFEKWYELTNGIEGERKGLETEALPRTRLREVFIDRMFDLGLLNEDIYSAFIKRSYCDKIVLETIAGPISNLKDEIFAEIEDEIDIETGFDIKELAVQGEQEILPEKYCDEIVRPEIKNLTIEKFYKKSSEEGVTIVDTERFQNLYHEIKDLIEAETDIDVFDVDVEDGFLQKVYEKIREIEIK